MADRCEVGGAGGEAVRPSDLAAGPGRPTGRGPVGVAVVGYGDISHAYLRELVAFPDLDVRWVVGRHPERAGERAREYGVMRSGSTALALADPDVEVVVDLTVPASHLEIGLAALQAGKHVWSEKPLATTPADALRLLEEARRRGLRVGSAPDSILSPAAQLFRAEVEAGTIGTPLTVSASYRSAGPESWHPRPAFLYDIGAGPLYDIGPYLIATLVHTLGPVGAVSAVSSRPRAERTVQAGPDAGTPFDVNVPTTVLALLTFRSGVLGTVDVSFDSALPPRGELAFAGTEGELRAGGELIFDADVVLRRPDGTSASLPARTSPFRRGVGVLDLARSLRTGAVMRTSGALAAHVLEVLAAIDAAGRDRTVEAVAGDADRGPLLDASWDPLARTL